MLSTDSIWYRPVPLIVGPPSRHIDICDAAGPHTSSAGIPIGVDRGTSIFPLYDVWYAMYDVEQNAQEYTTMRKQRCPAFVATKA